MGISATHAKRIGGKPFIVDVPASLLKQNPELSKAARVLYSTMRSLADGRTGALKIRGRWLKANAIDAAAEMCRDVRLSAMRELVALGLASAERERVTRVIGGRKRVVMGAVHYSVHRQPIESKFAQKRPFLLKSISSTVEKTDSQFLPESPSGAGSSVRASSVVSERGSKKADHHHREPSTADDDRSSRFEELQKTAQAILVGRGEDAEFVEAAVQFIDKRSQTHGTAPGSSNYYVAAYETLRHDSKEMAELWETVNRRRALRAKFMPGFTGELSAESERQRQEFNRGILAGQNPSEKTEVSSEITVNDRLEVAKKN